MLEKLHGEDSFLIYGYTLIKYMSTSIWGEEGGNHMHIFLRSYIKTCVKIQKCQPKTVRGVAYLIHMHLNSVRGKKKV